MDLLLVLAVFVVAPIVVLGYIGLFMEWRDRGVPFPTRPHPSLIFRIVERDERAVYVRIMRRTYAVAMRDLNRQMTQYARLIGKQLTPAFQRLADAMESMMGRR